MYKIISILSVIIRGFYIPNPFKDYFKSDLWYINASTIADIFNFLVGGAILHYSSFFLISSIYKSGEMSKAVGSICYLISFIINNYIMSYLCIKLQNINLQLIILIYFCIELILYFIIIKIKNFFKRFVFEY